MTPKLIAKPSSVHRYPKHAAFLQTRCGKVFTWAHLKPDLSKQIKVGDIVWVAKRLNRPTQDWCYELYPVVIQPNAYMVSQGFKNYPQTWFGNGRDIVWEVK